MFAIAAAVVFLLHAFGVLDTTTDVNWAFVGAGLWAAHFGLDVYLPVWRRRDDT